LDILVVDALVEELNVLGDVQLDLVPKLIYLIFIGIGL